MKLTQEGMREAALLAAADIFAALESTKDKSGEYMAEGDLAEIIQNRMVDVSVE